MVDLVMVAAAPAQQRAPHGASRAAAADLAAHRARRACTGCRASPCRPRSRPRSPERSLRSASARAGGRTLEGDARAARPALHRRADRRAVRDHPGRARRSACCRRSRILVVDSILGSLLLRSQGRGVWQRFNAALGAGRPPAREVLDGVLIIFGGALLLTPGFITDLARPAAAAPADARGHPPRARAAAGQAHGRRGPGGGRVPPPGGARRPGAPGPTTTSRARAPRSTRGALP